MESEPESPDATGTGPRRRGVLRGGVAALAVAAGVGGAVAATSYSDRADARMRGGAAEVPDLGGVRSVHVMWRAHTTDPVMALTFDDGPGATLTAPLLEVLREEKVRATFCLVGQRAYEHRDLVRQQMRDGHELANHTWTHADLSLLEYDLVRVELDRTDQLLAELTGRGPAVIRPPYGRLSGAVLERAALAHQDVLLWDVRFQESRFDSAGNAAYVLDSIGPGSVLLGHDNGSATRHIGTQAVPEIIREAKRRGYTFLTASEMLARDHPPTST